MRAPVSRTARRSLRASTFALPVVVGLLTSFGLLTALVTDGIWHVLAWTALSAPILAVVIGPRLSGRTIRRRRADRPASDARSSTSHDGEPRLV